MPLSAIEHVQVDAVRPAEEIAALLAQQGTVDATQCPPSKGGPRSRARDEERVPIMPRNSSGLTCPECSGALWEVKQGDLIQYRCRVGHAYSLDSMLAEQARPWRQPSGPGSLRSRSAHS